MDFLDTIIANISANITLGKLLTYSFLIAILSFIFVLWKTSKDDSNTFHWIDLISGPDGKASLTRILQFAAGITATWVIIQATIGKWLTVDIFAVYLAAMGISEGFTKWIQSKNQVQQKEEEK